MLIKVKFTHNAAILDIVNTGTETNFQARRNDMNCRFKVVRLLQDKARHTATKS